MNFEKIYQYCLKLYPKEINIADGKLFEHNKNSFYSENLTRISDKAFKDASIKGSWHGQVLWAISQTLHGKAREAFRDQILCINPEIDKKRFRYLLFDNLSGEEYVSKCQELHDYEKEHGQIAP